MYLTMVFLLVRYKKDYRIGDKLVVDLNQDVKYVKGVGPNRVVLLNKLGIYTLKDLITYYPREHEDRSKVANIVDIVDGQVALVEAVCVSKVNEIRTSRRNMTIYKLIARDNTGTIMLTWYNQSYLKQRFKLGEKYSFFGKVTKKDGVVTMVSPTFDDAGKTKNTGKIIPIYPLTYNLSQNIIRQIIENGLNLVKNSLEETLPQYLIDEYNLQDINSSINSIHFPKGFSDFEKARKRLVFEELLGMQLALLSLKNMNTQEETGIKFDENVKMSDVINTLPFKLTKAQLRVLEEIDKDMVKEKIEDLGFEVEEK